MMFDLLSDSVYRWQGQRLCFLSGPWEGVRGRQCLPLLAFVGSVIVKEIIYGIFSVLYESYSIYLFIIVS